MSVIIYGIKSCSTMKKAFTKLEDLEVDYQFHDYKKKALIRKAFNAGLMN